MLEYPHFGDLCRQAVGVGLGVVLHRAEQNQKPCADFTGYSAVDRDRSAGRAAGAAGRARGVAARARRRSLGGRHEDRSR